MSNTQRPTPETDALDWSCAHKDTNQTKLAMITNLEKCRKLERERDEAREQLEAMREAIKAAHGALTELVNLGSLELPQRRDSALLAGSTALAKLQLFLP